LIKLIIEIKEDCVLINVDLPEEPPSHKDCVKAIAATQFDGDSQSILIERLKATYGEDYYSEVDALMSEMIKSLKQLLSSSISLDPEIPAVPTVMLGTRIQK